MSILNRNGTKDKKSIYYYLDLLMGIGILLYIFILNKISPTRIAFTTPIVILGCLFVIYHFCKIKIKNTNNKNLKLIIKVTKVLMSIGIIVFVILEVMILSYPKYDESKSDYIVVLGAGLNYGTYPSVPLQDRLRAAYKCYDDNDRVGKIVVSGGQGVDEEIPEAEAMQKYLVDMGVSEEAIIMEDKSENTMQNLIYSKEKIEKDSGASIDDLEIKIVTTDFHALRSNFLAKRIGYKNVKNYSSETVWYFIPTVYAREGVAIVKSFIFDK